MLRARHILLSLLALSGVAEAQQIKSRVMVLLDTSGSMGFHFKDPATFCDPAVGGCVNPDFAGGDGSTLYSDGNVANQPWFPGKVVGNARDGVNSRLYAAKQSLNDAITAYAGNVDFGLSTFDFQLCPFAGPLCEPCTITCNQGLCNYTCLYTNPAFSKLVPINWRSQGCGGPGKGGRIIVPPATGSSPKILPWIDGVENFKDSADGNNTWGTGGGTPLNPEVRAEGDTPLAESIAVVRTQWYDAVKNGDPQVACRPYILVLETDGAQSYEGGGAGACGADPVAAAQALYNDGQALGNPVLTYVIGLSIGANDVPSLNNIAIAGGTGQARFANSQTDIEAAYADILARSVKVESCNGKDDNCNTFIDEGLGVFQECTLGNQCASGTCNAGRCTCNGNAQCGNGYSCGGGFCVPGCTTGVGACARGGVKKCGMNNSATCCLNDGQAFCAPLVAGNPGALICKPNIDNKCNGILDMNEPGCAMMMCNPVPEVCNGKDDDCDGVIDDNLVDGGKPCGLNVGICKAGTTACVNSKNQDISGNGIVPDAMDKLVCQGGVVAIMAQCNGCDNDCDGNVDAPSNTCYDGPMGTASVGLCHTGLQRCIAAVCPQMAAYGPCVGEVVPQKEICNGLDDDCDGKVDDVAGSGVMCCPSMRCGKGICTPGMMECSGGGLACIGGQGPLPETCNGIDDDCNGKVDDLPNVGQGCLAANGCPGTFQCDAMKMVEVCAPIQMNCNPNDCNGDPRVGTACGAGMGLPAPCKAGVYVCLNNQVICQGGQGPATETCNCVDDDCNGKVDDNSYCPGGTACMACQCVAACNPTEFPCDNGYDCINPPAACTKNEECPGPGQSCNLNSKQCGPGYCVPSGNCMPACDVGFDCLGGVCVDRCANINCGMGYKCEHGACVDISCRANASLCKSCVGGDGERCDVTQVPPVCVKDACCGKACDAQTQFCEPATGMCVDTCANVKCTGTDRCVNGKCQPQLCQGVKCSEGQACNPATGKCEVDKCFGKPCFGGAICCGGMCQADTCPSVQCPAGTRCVTNGFDCSHACEVEVAREHDLVVGAGGGGATLGCDVGGGAGRGGGPVGGGAAMIALAIGALVLRRRGGKEVVAALAACFLAACSPNPFCLDCADGAAGGAGDGGGGSPDLIGAGGDLLQTVGPDLNFGDGACSPDVMSDPKNCGSCGHACSYAHAGGTCSRGVCSIGKCNQGWYDTNHDPADGCELPCSPTAPGLCKVDADCPWGLPCNNGECVKTCKIDADCPRSTLCDPDTLLCEGELCDGKDNNCNGLVDEGIDLATDVANCGGCGAVCAPPNAVPLCSMRACSIGACNLDGKGGKFYDLDKNVADGCEYDCPVNPPRPETCNGIDDDCNGVIDDNPVDVGTPCDDACPKLDACVGNKACRFALSPCAGACCGICTEGKTICAGGAPSCQAGAGPQLEVCNNLDDNCDGQIDEGFDLKFDALNCGACGKVCSPPNAIGTCFNGGCAIAQCKPGFADLDKNPANGCEYTCLVNPPSVESCNGLDDDCNGVVDDNLVVPNNFCLQAFSCANSKPVCCGMAGWLCNYPSVNPKIEVSNLSMCQGGQQGGTLVFSEKLCDGFDGNCNGTADEAFTNLGKQCTVGTGACAGTSNYICDVKNPTQTTCPGAAKPMNAVDEVCNGIDDDCDGAIDERNPAMGSTCYNGNAHPCVGLVEPMVQVGNVWVHKFEASHLDATANAAGSAIGRACSRAGVLPWAPVTQPAAATACSLITDSKGGKMRLCSAAEWQAACDLSGAATWSYSANANNYQPMTCNGADAAVGKAWATATGAQCYSNVGGGIYDMSGNVAEWTTTPVMFNGTTYFKVRGGGYGSLAGATKCDFDFVIETDSYQFNDIGFRCCADAAP